MKVIDKSFMPNGTRILLEDWSDPKSDTQSDTHQRHNLTIGAYPIAKRTDNYGAIRVGKTFRLTIARNYTDEIAIADYNALKNGTKKLEDLAERFWDGKKDMWYLGMDVQEPQWDLY